MCPLLLSQPNSLKWSLPKMSLRILACLTLLVLCVPVQGQVNSTNSKARQKATADLLARIEASPRLPFSGVHFAVRPPASSWESGAVSGVAIDSNGNIYEIQRGDKTDPIIVLDHQCEILRAWGKGELPDPA
jgi:hypothetical protein